MGYIRGNSTDQQRLWREGARAQRLSHTYEYPTNGYEDFTLNEREINSTKLRLTQVNDYANKRRLYFVRREIGESESYWKFDKRLEADDFYEKLIKEASE